jgi:hypothetical protein
VDILLVLLFSVTILPVSVFATHALCVLMLLTQELIVDIFPVVKTVRFPS